MSIGSSGSETPSPPLSEVTGPVVGSVDEGIDMDDEGDDRKRQVSSRLSSRRRRLEGRMGCSVGVTRCSCGTQVTTDRCWL